MSYFPFKKCQNPWKTPTFEPMSGCPIAPPVFLPLGSMTETDGLGIISRVVGGQSVSFLAIPKNDVARTVEILPPYLWQGKVRLGKLGPVWLEIWEITREKERRRATEIILRSHYLNAPKRGLILGCRFLRSEDQIKAKNIAQETSQKDPWSKAWREGTNNMVACAVLDTLYQGKPLGRKELAKREGFDDLVQRWDTVTRSDMVTRLRIAWVSRFAVDAPYRSFGIGTVLAKKLREVAKRYRTPSADFIEVITTRPVGTKPPGIAKSSGGNDFLIKAGYYLIPKAYPSKPQALRDSLTGKKVGTASAKKYYYYAKTE